MLTSLLPTDVVQRLQLSPETIGSLVEAVRPLIREFTLDVPSTTTRAGPINISLCSNQRCGVQVFVRDARFDVEPQAPLYGLNNLVRVRFEVDVQTLVEGRRAPWRVNTTIGDIEIDLDTTRGRPGLVVSVFVGSLSSPTQTPPPGFWRVRVGQGGITGQIISTLLPTIVVGPVRVDRGLEPADFLIQGAQGSILGGSVAWTLRNNLGDLVKTASNTINGAVSSLICEQIGAPPCPPARYATPALGGFFRDATIILAAVTLGGWFLYRGVTKASAAAGSRLRSA